MRSAKSWLFCALCFLLLSAQIDAITLKIGSLVPAGSPWDRALRTIAAEWTRLSDGLLSVRIYPAGVAGDEPDMVRKVRIGQLDAAMITMSGLQRIFNGVKTLSFPLFVSSDKELDYVLDKMRPFFERELEKRGFKVVLWSSGGWLYFFSRRPVTSPDDLRKQKLWVWGDPDEMREWQRSGFQVVPLASTDITTSLQSGMIDAMISSPLLVASNQWFGITSNMADMKLAPLWGAVIVSMKTWSKIPEDLRPRLIRTAQETADGLDSQISKADSQAISVMKGYGLRINEVDASERREWNDLVQRGFGMLIGSAYDEQSYLMAKGFLEELAASH